MKSKTRGVSQSDFKDGGCDREVVWERVTIWVEKGREEENLGCVGRCVAGTVGVVVDWIW